MSDPAYPMQVALVAAIKALNTAAGNNVFDRVPSSDPFPRVTIGNGQSIGDYADCYDGTERYVQIDVWSRKTGYPEAQQIAEAIRDMINAETLTVAGHIVHLIEARDIVETREADGLTSRARMTVRALTQPA